jgi:RHS repeat-associated protein
VPGIAASTSTYDANDRVSGESFDSNGDQLTREGRTQSFDSQDRLTSSAPTSGASVHVYYDGDGNRVAVDVGGSLVSYLVDDQNPTGYSQVVEERGGGNVSKSWVFGRKAISQRAKGTGGAWTSNYYAQDGHGSVVLLTDSVGVITDTYEYDAFGTVIGRTGTTANAILYTGEWFDAEQGLEYLRARWYSPNAGTFSTRDSHPQLGDIETYQYTSNEPVNAIDPEGTSWFTEIGNEVQNKICDHFLSKDPAGRMCNRAISTILSKDDGIGPGIPRKLLAYIPFRPDLIDRTNRLLYEVKPDGVGFAS